jgi:hypothetical protein
MKSVILAKEAPAGRYAHHDEPRRRPAPAPLPLTSRLAIAAMRIKSSAKFSTPLPLPSRLLEIADMLQEAAERITALEALLAPPPGNVEIDQ